MVSAWGGRWISSWKKRNEFTWLWLKKKSPTGTTGGWVYFSFCHLVSQFHSIDVGMFLECFWSVKTMQKEAKRISLKPSHGLKETAHHPAPSGLAFLLRQVLLHGSCDSTVSGPKLPLDEETMMPGSGFFHWLVGLLVCLFFFTWLCLRAILIFLAWFERSFLIMLIFSRVLKQSKVYLPLRVPNEIQPLVLIGFLLTRVCVFWRIQPWD